MKKFVSIFLLLAICMTFAACSDIKNYGKESVRVQQFVYSDGDFTRNLVSKFYFDYTEEEVDASEYEAATNKLDKYFYREGEIEVDGTVKNTSGYYFNNGETPEELNKYVGKTYYGTDGYGRYCKITYTALHLSYLDVTFISDDTFEVTYYDDDLKGMQTLRIKTEYYTMAYFSTKK